jgi:hypothetical protein
MVAAGEVRPFNFSTQTSTQADIADHLWSTLWEEQVARAEQKTA